MESPKTVVNLEVSQVCKRQLGLVISVIATKVVAGMEVRRLKVIRAVSRTTTSSLPISSAFILLPQSAVVGIAEAFVAAMTICISGSYYLSPLQSLDWALSPDTEWEAHASSMQE
ncbi:hypothetical protein PVL29_014333 [Vitis rotundifolia]|uniref:Uncharacterized protein n=1 Tax=Vitis rotundifolia TaxID=103349 RepID=A0AA38ZGX5_VITRO|nr:hypothetical protein PVL29_014333 [Vitis rotundifolia]